MPFDARRIASALTRKGFVERESHHTFYHLHVNGKDAGVFTKISHGEREVGDALAKKMQKQMHLPNLAAFRDFVDCPMSAQEYLTTLRRAGIIAEVS
jgi:hypothetical protein